MSNYYLKWLNGQKKKQKNLQLCIKKTHGLINMSPFKGEKMRIAAKAQTQSFIKEAKWQLKVEYSVIL